MTHQKTKDMARGKWRSILLALGVRPELLNSKHQPCPRCGGKDRFRFTDYQCSGGFICNQCGGGSGFDLLCVVNGWDFKRAAYEVDRTLESVVTSVSCMARNDEELRAATSKLWESGSALTASDPAGRYLWARCRTKEYSPALRIVHSARCSGERDHPAMLALISAPNGRPCQIHRTYLNETGSKASIDSPRRMMPGLIEKGASVRLTVPAATLGIAEGIETALSATAISGVPCWAALSADMIRNWQAPEITEQVVIFADHDESYVGQEAAYALARRLGREGRKVDVRIPQPSGWDWNDVHRESFSMPA